MAYSWEHTLPRDQALWTMKRGSLRMRMIAVLGLACVGGAITLAINATSSAGQKVTVGSAWPANQRISPDEVDHAAWDRLLDKYVDEEGYVDYRAWHKSRADRQALTGYLAGLSRAHPRRKASREAKLAFWINAYNAVTIEGILREYPTDSIRNHTARFVGYNIWKDLLLIVGSEQFSLEQMEHEILRKMGEPRIHFAIVCASIGCPRLLNEAYTAKKLDEQLTSNARHFFADPGKFQADGGNRRIRVSPILDWFAQDFGASQAEQLKAIAAYLPDERARQLANSGQARVQFLDYDWSLNDQARRR